MPAANTTSASAIQAAFCIAHTRQAGAKATTETATAMRRAGLR